MHFSSDHCTKYLMLSEKHVQRKNDMFGYMNLVCKA